MEEINEIPTEALRAVSAPLATKVLSRDNVPVVVTALSVLPTHLLPPIPLKQHIWHKIKRNLISCYSLQVGFTVLTAKQ